MTEGESYQACEWDQLLLDIDKRQGDHKKLTDILYRKCKSFHFTDTLDELLDVIVSRAGQLYGNYDG